MNPSLLLLLFQVDSLGNGLRPQVQRRRRRRVAPLRGIPRGRRGRRAAVPLVAALRRKRLRPREGERGERRGVEDGGVVDGHAVGVVAGGGGRTEHGHHSVAPAKFVC